MLPQRIAQIREIAQSEHCTHERLIEELLTEIARVQAVEEPARLAVQHLRRAAYRLKDAGDTEADEFLATADVLADELAQLDI